MTGDNNYQSRGVLCACGGLLWPVFIALRLGGQLKRRQWLAAVNDEGVLATFRLPKCCCLHTHSQDGGFLVPLIVEQSGF